MRKTKNNKAYKLLKNGSMLILLGIFMIALGVAAYYINNYNWNDDFETGTLNTTFWGFTGTATGDSGTCTFSHTEDAVSATDGYMRVLATYTCSANTATTGALTRTNFQYNTTQFKLYRFIITLNTSVSGTGSSNRVSIDISNGTSLSGNEFADNTDGITLASLYGNNSKQTYNLFISRKSAAAWLYNSTGALIGNGSYQGGLTAVQFRAATYGGAPGSTVQIYVFNFTAIDADTVSLSTPANSTGIANTTNALSASIRGFNNANGQVINLTNATVYVWNSTGSLINQTTLVISGNTTNNTYFNVSNLAIARYTWNVFACGLNNSGTVCDFGVRNNTFDFGYLYINEAYRNTTFEGNNEYFQLNLSLFSGTQISVANLVWNSTNYQGTIGSIGGDNYSLTRLLTIPNFNSQANVTFYWNVTLDNGFSFVTPTASQTVNVFTIDNCSSNTVLVLNYTLKDEASRSTLNATSQNATIQVDVDISPLGSINPIAEFSQTYNATNPARVCLPTGLLNTSTYRLDAVAQYESSNRVNEYYNIQNFTLTNNSIPQNIDLYDLDTATSVEFKITFKDSNYLLVKDALVVIGRKYVGLGQTITVEIPMTGADGATKGHFDLDSIYDLTIMKEGRILASFPNVIPLCDNQAIGDCQINLNERGSSVDTNDFTNANDISYTLFFNETGRKWQSVFIIPSGGTSMIELNATKFDGFGNTTACSSVLTSSFGSLECSIPTGYGNITTIAALYKDGQLISQRSFTIGQDAAGTFGGTRVILAMVMICTIPLLAMASSPIIVAALVVISLIASTALGFTEGTLIGAGSALLWGLVAVGLLAWKRSREVGG